MSAQFINTVMVIAAAAIVLFIIYQLVKGIINLAAVVLLLILLYAGYLSYTGQKMPQGGDEIIQRLSECVEVAREKGGGVLKTMLKTAPEKEGK